MCSRPRTSSNGPTSASGTSSRRGSPCNTRRPWWNRWGREELVAAGSVEVPHDVPVSWVERYLQRSGGWRLAPELLVEQLAALEPPAGLVLIPRRQPKKLNAALDHLGERADV